MKTSKSRRPMILLGLVTLLATALATTTFAALNTVNTYDTKPADPAYSVARTVFDCLPPDSLTIRIDTVTTLSDSTTGRDNLISSYPCAAWSEGGPELIYRLDLATDMELTALLSGMDPALDLDLFLLDDCDSESCLVGANTSFSADMTAGIYYLIVDGDSRAPLIEGDFTLTLTSRHLGVPLSICEAGGALPVECASELITIENEDLFAQPNLIQEYDCGNFPRTSGDLWYALTLPATHEVTVNVRGVAEFLDINLWFFDGCGPAAKCLQYVDDNLADNGETLTWVNDTDSEQTAYLAVDAVRPLLLEGSGIYTIDFQCQSNVATDQTSFGSLKALYR